METIKVEIQEALDRLRNDNFYCLEIPDQQAEQIYKKALAHFVKSGERRWWWEDFNEEPAIMEIYNDGYKIIKQIVPNVLEKVWFIVEEDRLPFYPVYETTPKSIIEIIGECYAFEYYIIPKDFRYLICENHHNILFGIGKEVKENIDKIKSEAGWISAV